MDAVFRLLCYLCVGGIGGLLGSKLKIPAGAMFGAMFGVIAMKLILNVGWELPRPYRLLVQILLGIMLGASFHPEMIKTFHKMLLPIMVSALTLIITGLILTVIFTKTGILDQTTAYLGTSPGAMTSLIMLAAETPADAPLITCFHFFRLLIVILIAPYVLKYLSG